MEALATSILRLQLKEDEIDKMSLTGKLRCTLDRKTFTGSEKDRIERAKYHIMQATELLKTINK